MTKDASRVPPGHLKVFPSETKCETQRAFRVLFRVSLPVFCAVFLAGCDAMAPATPDKLISRAEQKAAEGDYSSAIGLYEKALDGSAQTADVHFRLGLIYDDKLHQPVNAIHHFQRFLEYEPKGKRAEEVRSFIKRDELGLVTSLSRGVVLTEADAVKLRNENLSLRKQNTELKDQIATISKTKPGVLPVGTKPKPAGPSARAYIVQSGDTLAAISRKFYNTSGKWKDILEANAGELQDAARLKVGQRLVIP